jgi:hypothetical protein
MLHGRLQRNTGFLFNCEYFDGPVNSLQTTVLVEIGQYVARLYALRGH